MVRGISEIEVRVGKRADQTEERRKSHAEDGQQARVSQMLPAFGERMSNAGCAHKALGRRQRALHDDRARQVHQPDRDEGFTPGEIVGHNSGDVSSQKSTQHGSRNVGRHGSADVLPRKLLIDVGHDDHDHAGNEDALHESPEDELMQISRSGRQQRWRGQRVERRYDDFLAADGFGQ